MGGNRRSGSIARRKRDDDLICAVIRGEVTGWPGDEGGEEVEAFLARAEFHGVLPLLNGRLRNPELAGMWPTVIRDRCRKEALSWAAWDLAQRYETMRLLAAFRESGVKPLLLKGAALAYSHYSNPALRPRGDVDLLVAAHDKGRTEELLGALGYARDGVPMGEFISQESSWSRVDRRGAGHTVDLHWRSNNSPILAKLLDYEEMSARAVAVSTLGPDTATPCPVHALLFACIHRAGHVNAPYDVDGVRYPAKERLIWLYDIHLLASQMAPIEIEEVAAIASRKRMTAICREALMLCEQRFGLQVPPAVMQTLQSGDDAEPSSRFFRGGRLFQMTGDLLALDGPGERIGWLKELAFPSVEYMHAKYPSSIPQWLPVLYVRRAFEGIWKLATAK